MSNVIYRIKVRGVPLCSCRCTSVQKNWQITRHLFMKWK